MTAYDFLQQYDNEQKISAQEFADLITTYKDKYLSENDYYNRLANHRKPAEVVYDIIKLLERDMCLLQGRPEMQHSEHLTHTCVPSKINELWKSNRHLKSLYRTIEEFVRLYERDFNMIAAHIAEYRAMILLYRKMKRIHRKYQPRELYLQDPAQPAPALATPKKKRVKARPGVTFKLKAQLQKEISSVCPFCGSEAVGHFEVHHIDENPANNDINNLLMVCPTCHSKITKKDITLQEVIQKKKLLQKFPHSPAVVNITSFFTSSNDFIKGMGQLLNDRNSVYYQEIKEHWNSYSLIEDQPFLNELLNTQLTKSIHYGLLPIVADFSRKHLFNDRVDKYVYNQPYQHLHNKKEEGFDLPVYSHIKLIGILYATAISKQVDIDVLSNKYHSMLTIYSGMIEGMIANIIPAQDRLRSEFPTNYHWLINEIFWIFRNWIDALNETAGFADTSSYPEYVASNIRYCLNELYKAADSNKIEIKFLVSIIHYGILSPYFSTDLNPSIKRSLQTIVISHIPKKYIEPVLSFSLDEEFAISVDEFVMGSYHVMDERERAVLADLRNVLLENSLLS